MSAELVRQADGGAGRQKQDAGAALLGFGFGAAFLDANLDALALPPLTLEAVRAAAPGAELVRTADGQSVLRSGDALLGRAPDEDELRRLVASDGDVLYVVFGLGLGHTARTLRALTDCPIVIFEPDPGVLRSVLELGPTDLSQFHIVSNTHDLTQIWPLAYGNRRTAVFVTSSGYADAHADAAADLRATLAQLVQRSGINDATHRLRAREWIEDVLANIELLCEHPGFLALAGKYRGVPAFIVGAGPSLGKNGHELVQAQKKGIVFAVNSSARALARYGAEPHVLACMESIDVSHLLRDIAFIDRVVRAFTLSAHPNTLRTGRGPLLPLYEGQRQISGPIAELTGHKGLPVSGSVSTMIFSLAQRLGCSPIVLVGQDLAYTDGKAYAPGTPYEESSVQISADGKELELKWCDTLKSTHNVGGRKMHETEPLSEVEAWGGERKVLTGVGFSAVRAWLETAAVEIDRGLDTRLVNATEGGARVAGFEEIPLADLLATLPDRDITPESIARDAAEAAPTITPRELAGWAEKQADGAGKSRRAARRVKKLSEVARAAARSNDPDVTRRFLRLDDAERALSRSVIDSPLLDAWSWCPIDDLMDERPADDASDHKQNAERALAFESRLADTIDESARELESELRKLSQRLRARPTVR